MKKLTASSHRRESATDDGFDFFTRPSIVLSEGLDRLAHAKPLDDDLRSNARAIQHGAAEADTRIDDNDAWVQLRIRIGIRLTSFLFSPAVCWRRDVWREFVLRVLRAVRCVVRCVVLCCAGALLVLTSGWMMDDDAGCGMRDAGYRFEVR